MSFDAYSRPIAISAFTVTPSGGGLAMSNGTMGVSIVICQQRVSGRASIFMGLVDSALRLQLCRYLHHVVEECKSNDVNREALPPTFWHPGG